MKRIFLGLVWLVIMSVNLYGQDTANIDLQADVNVDAWDAADVDTQDAVDVDTQDAVDGDNQDTVDGDAQDITNEDTPERTDADVQEGADVKAQNDTNADVQTDATMDAGRVSGGVDWQKFEEETWAKMQAKGMTEAQFHQAIAYSYVTKEFGNRMDKAAAHFKKAVELDPSLYLSWYTLGLQFIESDEGRWYFQRATEVKPDYAPPYYWLAYVYCQNRRDVEAAPLLEKYLELAQEDLTEAQRVPVAKKILAELRTGVDGEFLKALRKEQTPVGPTGQIPPAGQ